MATFIVLFFDHGGKLNQENECTAAIWKWRQFILTFMFQNEALNLKNKHKNKKT